MNKTRIMIITDAFYMGTGFSNEMLNVGFRLAQSGEYDVYYLGLQYFGFPLKFYDFQFEEIPHKGAYITALGNTGNPNMFGTPAFKRHYMKYAPDFVLFMGDPRNIRPYVEPPFDYKRKLGFALLMYVTLDGLPIHPRWRIPLGRVDGNIAMTEWAMNEYMKEDIPIIAYIYHGENTKYWTRNEETKRQLREQYGIPQDITLFYCAEVNQHRKRMDALLRCWRDAHPETKKMKLFLNTDWDCRLGCHIPTLIDQYNVPRETIISPEDLYGEHKNWELSEPINYMRDAMAMADIYLNTTSGEGQGKNHLQALCMKIPVITGNYSAMPECLRRGAILVDPYLGRPGKFRWHDKARTVEGWIINEEKFTEAILRLYDNPSERRELGEQGREWALNFDYDDHIAPAWLDVLSRINPDALLMKNILNI